MNKVSDIDLQLKDIFLDDLPRLNNLRSLQFERDPQICIELPWLMTKYMKEKDDQQDSPELRAGKRLKYILQNKSAIINDNSLLAGTTTTKTIGALMHPHFQNSIYIWPEIEKIHNREKDPLGITTEDIKKLNSEIFPYWADKTIMARLRKEYHYPVSQKVKERIGFFLCVKATSLSHTIPNYAAVLDLGLKKIREDAETEESKLGDTASDREKAHFYQAVRLVIDGVLDYAKRLSEKAYELAKKESDPKRKQELGKMGDVCAKVPREASETFQEALNAIWICKVALHQENINAALSLGRLDQVLLKQYHHDVKRGMMPPDKALELVGCFWLKLADHVALLPEVGQAFAAGAGSNQAITLGGVLPKDGEPADAVNELTYIMLRATELLKLRDPNVNCRYYAGVNKPEYLKRLCEVNFNTRATPCYQNDIAIIEALESQGLSEEHAMDYAIVGCVEPTSAGRTFGHCGAALMNLTPALEMTLFQGKHDLLTAGEDITKLAGVEETKKPDEIKTFDIFKEEFKKHVCWMIDHIVDLNNKFGRVHQLNHPSPLLSTLMEGCMDKGKDVIQGGARYNSSGVAIIGLAEVVDSLTAIEEFVFNENNENKIPLIEMIKAIKQNWGYDTNGNPSYIKLRERIKNSEHKYGTGSDKAVRNAEYIMDLLHEEFQKKENYRGGKYTVGYWTMTYHTGFGLMTGALPSGRLRQEPLPSGITPVSGSARELSPCLNFVAGLNRKNILNGQALNLKFMPSKNRERDVIRLADTLETYMKLKGLQVQFNIIDRTILEDAMKYPKKPEHRDLLVRVSGYTAYFIDLNEHMQKEIINRAEYNLETGQQTN